MRGWTVLACGVLLAGCGRSAFMGAGGQAGGAMLFLPGAGEEAAGPDDFVEEAGKPVPALQKEEEPVEEAEARPRQRRFGVRVGYLGFVGAAEREVDPAFVFGGSYDLKLKRESPLSLELGIDAAPAVTTVSGDYTSVLVFARAGAKWSFSEERRIRTCVAGGVAGLFESTRNEASGTTSQNSAALIDIGAGLRDGQGRWEGRVSYVLPVGSSNVSEFLMLSLGLGF